MNIMVLCTRRARLLGASILADRVLSRQRDRCLRRRRMVCRARELAGRRRAPPGRKKPTHRPCAPRASKTCHELSSSLLVASRLHNDRRAAHCATSHRLKLHPARRCRAYNRRYATGPCLSHLTFTGYTLLGSIDERIYGPHTDVHDDTLRRCHSRNRPGGKLGRSVAASLYVQETLSICKRY